MTITPEGSRVGVNARIDKAYEAYRDGSSIDEVITKVADAVEKAFYNMPDVNRLIPDLEKYENVKDRLVLEVVSAEANAKILEIDFSTLYGFKETLCSFLHIFIPSHSFLVYILIA